ncbi:mechanosensitive ion channel family protein [Halovenus halobia]|uniref:mechanosensitive ion channel family protein n=1 Tax=Halovenus halobia TaxID=3396622 RepID=UPI003F57F249
MTALPRFPGLTSKYGQLVGQVTEFVVVTLVVYLFGRFVLLPAAQWLFARRKFEPTLERAIEKVLRLAVVVGAVAIGFGAAGFSGILGGGALIVAALTLAVGFAAQDVLSNFVAGVFIVQDKNFNIGDWIEWDDRAGFIDDIGFRVTRVRTFDNETVTVPNTELATTAVTNRMSNERLRISYIFGIGYGDDIDKTTDILHSAAEESEGILDDPGPSVRIIDLGDTAVLLQSRIWISDPDREDFSATRSAYIRDVKERCERAGIDLSTTTQHSLSGTVAVEDVAQSPQSADG